MNSVNIIGNLTKDMELSYLSSGTALGKLSIAVNDKIKKGDQWVDEVSYFDVSLWGKTAENLKQYLTKGKKVAISGKLKQDRWTDQQSGATRSKVQIVASGVDLLGGNPQQSNEPAPYSGSDEVPGLTDEEVYF